MIDNFNHIPPLSKDDWDILQSNLNKELDEKTIHEIRKWAGIANGNVE